MKSTCSIVFTGDIGFDHYMDRMWEDPKLLDPDVLRFLNSGDHLCVNVEGALSKGEHQVAPNGVAALMHSMDPDVAGFLANIRADIWNLANNHIMDAGPVGMSDTLAAAKKNGALTIGAGMNLNEASKPIWFDEAGGIGMFAVGYQRGCKKALPDYPGSLPWNDMDRIRNIISDIKSHARWCVIVAHGGEEFTSLPTCYTRDRYLEYLKMGADVIIGHHPHVPMNYEIIEEGQKAIFYSLGNFIFDTNYQRAQFNTEKGLFLKVDFSSNEFSFTPYGIIINRTNEHIEPAALPKIFENVTEKDYRLLEPLAAKMFIAATKRQQIYLNPARFSNATDEEWLQSFMEEKRSGRVPGEGLDFQIILPIAAKEGEKAWKNSTLEDVKQYIIDQM